jgi:branched-chain amino acid transport system substrate-binding protein
LPAGVAGKQGAILALEEINYSFAGRPIKFIVEDEASDPAVAMDKARKLVETDKVCMILGPFHGGCGGAVAGYVNKIKIPNVAYWYSISNDAIMGVNWTWAPFGTLSSVAYPTGAYAYEKLGYRTLSTMGTDYVAGREFIGGARAAFEERGGKIIQEQWIPLGTRMFLHILLPKEADADLAWFMGVTIVPSLKQLKEYRLKTHHHATIRAFNQSQNINRWATTVWVLMSDACSDR